MPFQRLIISATLVLCALEAAHCASFQGIGGLAENNTGRPAILSNVQAVSGDGSTVVGGSFGRAFRWTRDEGMTNLGSLSGAGSFANDVSVDGSFIVGLSSTNSPGLFTESFIWTPTNGMVGIGAISGGVRSEANAISDDGRVVAGESNFVSADGDQEETSYRWTQADGFLALTVDDHGDDGFATGVSADGSVVVGTGNTTNGLDAGAFRYTESEGLQDLGAIPGGSFQSDALGISADGLTIVGRSSSSFAPGDFEQEAFIWRAETGMKALGEIAGERFIGEAWGVSADGSI